MRLRSLFFSFALVVCPTVWGQTYVDIHDFGGTVVNSNNQSGSDGQVPNLGSCYDKSGNMYGTAYSGGAFGDGMVWEITNTGVYKDLHDFGGTVVNANGVSGPDGVHPSAGVTLDSSGNLYGDVALGGPNGNSGRAPGGIVWEITASGKYLDLHDFGGTITNVNGASIPDGYNPSYNVALDSAGDIFGTALDGGQYQTSTTPAGMLWEITKSGTYKDVHDFGGTVINANGQSGMDGHGPDGVAFDSQGDMYGVTKNGGPNYPGQGGSGMIWEITKAGVYRDVHDFGGIITYSNGGSGLDGNESICNVAFDAAGDVFGTCNSGVGQNAPNSMGMVWELTTSGSYIDLHDFGGTIEYSNGQNGKDGYEPAAGVTFDAKGNMYGSASSGGADGGGIVWEIPKSGGYQDLYDFGGTVVNANGKTGYDGSYPWEVDFDPSGNMSGTCRDGGPNGGLSGEPGNDGMVWRFTPPSVLQSVSVPSSVVGSLSVTGTVTLSGPAPSSGFVVNLTSSGASATVPSTVTVASGKSSATFTVTTSPVASNTSVTITAKAGSVSTSASFTILPPTLIGLGLNPTSLIGGSASTGTVTLNDPAPTGGFAISLSSSSSSATLPVSVSVAAGKTSATFTISSVPVSTATSATITANAGSVSKTVVLTVQPPSLTGLALNPASVAGGATTTGTMTLSGPAPSSGLPITLTSSTGAAVPPSSVTVASGKNYATFTITTKSISADTTATITAKAGSVSKTATLTITSLALNGFALSPTLVVSGATSTGTVTLASPAPAGGFVISLSSSSSSATLPSSVTVAAGKSYATFVVSTGAVASNTAVTLTAKAGGISKTATLTITPIALNGFALSPTSVTGGTSSKGTITLNGPAPAGGLVVTLSSSSSSATLPSSVTVAAGKNYATFIVSTTAVSTTTTATITVKQGSVTKTANLTVGN